MKARRAQHKHKARPRQRSFTLPNHSHAAPSGAAPATGELHSMEALAPVFAMGETLTVAVERYIQRTPGRARTLDIVLAGAGITEYLVKDFFAQIVRRITNEHPFTLTLVGNDLPTEFLAQRNLLSVPGLEDDSNDLHPTLLAHFHQRHPKRRPDLIFLFQPCIGYYRDLWLRDTGLREYVRAGVPVALAAESPSFAQGDRALLEAAGYQLSDLIDPTPPDDAQWHDAYSNQQENTVAPCAHFLYSITGIDLDRWHAQDTAKVQAYDAHLLCLKQEPDFVLNMRLREKNTTGAAYKQRLDEALLFEKCAEGFHHSHLYARRFMAPPQSPKLQNDDYAAAYLVASAKQGRIDEIQCFLREHPAAIRAVDGFGRSPLHWAAMHDHAQAVEFLVDAGYDINQVSDAGETPLSEAARRQCGRAVRALLGKGAQMYVGPQGVPFQLLQQFIQTIDSAKH